MEEVPFNTIFYIMGLFTLLKYDLHAQIQSPPP